jgi:hypothetical protein
VGSPVTGQFVCRAIVTVFRLSYSLSLFSLLLAACCLLGSARSFKILYQGSRQPLRHTGRLHPLCIPKLGCGRWERTKERAGRLPCRSRTLHHGELFARGTLKEPAGQTVSFCPCNMFRMDHTTCRFSFHFSSKCGARLASLVSWTAPEGRLRSENHSAGVAVGEA